MLAQRRRRWDSIKATLAQCPAFAGYHLMSTEAVSRTDNALFEIITTLLAANKLVIAS